MAKTIFGMTRDEVLFLKEVLNAIKRRKTTISFLPLTDAGAAIEKVEIDADTVVVVFSFNGVFNRVMYDDKKYRLKDKFKIGKTRIVLMMRDGKILSVLTNNPSHPHALTTTTAYDGKAWINVCVTAPTMEDYSAIMREINLGSIGTNDEIDREKLSDIVRLVEDGELEEIEGWEQ